MVDDSLRSVAAPLTTQKQAAAVGIDLPTITAETQDHPLANQYPPGSIQVAVNTFKNITTI